MNQPKKRRRFLLPLLVLSGLVTAGGARIWQVTAPAKKTPDQAALEAANPESKGADDNGLDAAAASWAAESGSTPPSDPFLKVASPSVVQPASYTSPVEPAVGDRYAATPAAYEEYGASTLELARGQSPGQGESELQASSSNPLRATGSDARYNAAGAAEARQAFGEVLAADARVATGPAEPNPLREPAALPVDEIDSREVSVAYEDDAAEPDYSSTPIPFEPGPVDAYPLDETPPGPLATQPSQDAAAAESPVDLPSYNQLRSPAPPSASPAAIAAEPIVEEAPDRMASVVTERTQLPAAAPRASSRSGIDAPQPSYETAPAPTASYSQASPAFDSQFSSPQPLAEVAAPVVGAGRPGERAMEGRQQPTLAIQKFAPAEVQVGKSCKFITKVRNMGQRPAMGVVVRDQTPAGSRLMATTPQAETASSDIRWDLGTLAPGEERTLEMEITPTEEGEIGSVATVTFAAHATARSRCTRPQLAIRMTAPDRVLVGRQQRVQIELKNPGTGDATGVMLTENVPENLRHEAGAALEFEVGTLRAGETRTMELVMRAEKAGKVVNTLTARADGNLEVQQAVEFEVVAPELSVGVDGPKRRYLERPATYTVSINNPGTASAKDVRLVTKLPQGMRFVKATNLGEYDATTHSVYWSLAELPEGEQGKVELTALPVTSGELTLQVEGQASEGLKDETAMAVKIEGIAALQFEVLDVEDPIEVGGETVYEVRVENQGTKGATNVGVRFITPPGMRAIAASGATRHTVQNGAVVFSPIDRLAPQATANFRIRVEGMQAGDHRLTVEVTSDDLAQPVRKEESTRVFGDE